VKRVRRKIEEALWVTGLHAPVRSLYRVTAGRNRSKVYDMTTEFYRKLVPSDVLVFDIGANVGMFSEIFSSLGAKVVALEPNSDCVRHIQLSYPDAGIEVIQAVAGATNGLATINLSDERDDISSVSNDWIEAIKQEHHEYEGLWSRRVAIPMLTLDTLIQYYGKPYFIKIDVEGFEESVLEGLSAQPPLLSFECNTAYLEATMRCLDKKCFDCESVFNFAMGDPGGFELENWVGKQTLKQALDRLGKGDRHGDIFVRNKRLVNTGASER
jgi:FkbM family methyltransferase